MATAAAVPPNLKQIAHYVKIGNEHSTRDPVVYYWCMMYACQQGMKIDRNSPESKQYLGLLLGALEQIKQANRGNEAITNDLVAQAHLEQKALQLFTWADAQDRAGNFDKNVVKAFYTAGYLFDLLALFSMEMDERIVEQRKYAKWKAAYIHNCLKNGEVPQSGPIGEDGMPTEDFAGPSVPVPMPRSQPAGPAPLVYADVVDRFTNINIPAEKPVDRPTAAQHKPPGTHSNPGYVGPAPTSSGERSTAECLKAQKYCKYAASALEYDDVPTAVENLEKALRLLKTGVDA